MEWLNFKLMVAFGRKQAPVMRLAGALAAGESLFLIQGEIPNRKGQPVIHEWFAVRFTGHRNVGVLPLQEFLNLSQLDKRTYPNSGEFEIPLAITSLLPDAVAEARRYMSSRRQEFQQNLQARLQEQILSLNTLQNRQLSFLEFEFPEGQALLGSRRNRKLERRRRIDEVFADYRRWVEETLTTEDSPFLRVAAVFLG
jgi:hypothetical protein